MKATLIAVYVCLALAQTSIAANLNLTLYYEALCPDSKDFLVNQLYPVYNSPLKDVFSFELVPYGKAITTPTTNGSYTFTCQHGPRECYANMMQACSLSLYGEERTLSYAQCMMSKSRPDKFAVSCATDVGLNADKISKCQASTTGPELLKILGDQTHNLNPKMVFVPWILFNNQFNQKDQNDALADLKSVICSKLPNKPNGC